MARFILLKAPRLPERAQPSPFMPRFGSPKRAPALETPPNTSGRPASQWEALHVTASSVGAPCGACDSAPRGARAVLASRNRLRAPATPCCCGAFDHSSCAPAALFSKHRPRGAGARLGGLPLDGDPSAPSNGPPNMVQHIII